MAGAKHAGRIVAITTAAAVILAACSSGSKGGAGSGHAGKARSAVTTTDADWKPVADALGRSGKLGDNNTAYRINLPRNDLHITSYGVDIKPGLSLGGYAAFARYDNNETLLMGDLVITEEELPKSPMRCRRMVSPRPHCTSICCSKTRRCGGPTFTAWVMPPDWPKDSRRRWMPQRSARLPHRRHGNHRSTSTSPASTRRWAAREPKMVGC